MSAAAIRGELGQPTIRASHRIAVVGMPGTGKSTLLNTLIKHFKCSNVEKFRAEATPSSVTKEVGQRILQIPAYNEQGQVVPNTFIQLILVDTMGWPDTDPTKAVDMYDEVVVKALNHTDGLTAVIWVVDGKRDDRDTLAKYKAFMTEISMVNSKILLLVNGRENYSEQEDEINDAEHDPTLKAKLEKELAALKEKDRKAMHKIADNAVEQVNPENPRRFVKLISTNVRDLNKKIPLEIHKHISDQVRSCRNTVRTFEEMALAMENSEVALKEHTKDMQSTIKRLETEKANAEWYNSIGLYGGGGAAGAAALGTLYVTSGFLTGGATWVAGAALAATATSGAAYTFVYDGHADEKGQELEEQKAKFGNKLEMLKGAKLREENFKALCQFCQVDHVEFLHKVKERRQRHGA